MEPSPEAARPARPKMIIVPAGRFMMGSPATEPGRSANEELHEVQILAPFAIGETEVTQAQWEAVMGSNPSWFVELRGGGGEHPVEMVSWFDALEYLNRLSEREGLTPCYRLEGCEGRAGGGCAEPEMAGELQAYCAGDFSCSEVQIDPECVTPGTARKNGYRLPAEAEWEYAARAGTTTPVYGGPSSDEVLARIAWFGVNASARTHPAGGRAPNAWLLRDAIGNVLEWTSDAYDADARKNGDASRVPDGYAVVRGCGFFGVARVCRAAARGFARPASRFASFGFRPARSIPRSSIP